MSKLKGPDGRIPDRLPDGRPAVATSQRGRVPSVHLISHATAGLPSGNLSGIRPSGPFNLLIIFYLVEKVTGK